MNKSISGTKRIFSRTLILFLVVLLGFQFVNNYNNAPSRSTQLSYNWGVGTGTTTFQRTLSAPSEDDLTNTSVGDDITVVLVEIRCHKSLWVILQQAVVQLKGTGIRTVVWHSSYNEFYLTSLINEDPILQKEYQRGMLLLHPFDPTEFGFNGKKDHKRVRYRGSYWYQSLIKSRAFYESIPTTYMINMQTDTLICRPPDDDLIKLVKNGRVKFLGGMTSKRVHPNRPSLDDSIGDTFLNGGFSLRSVPWSLECIDRFARNFTAASEDVFWNRCQKLTKNSNNSDTDDNNAFTHLEAYAFGSDNGSTQCYVDPQNKSKTVCPFGVHKPWKVKKRRAKARRGKYSQLESACPGLSIMEANQKHFVNQRTCNISSIERNMTIPCDCG
jgi:hypothetical protein